MVSSVNSRMEKLSTYVNTFLRLLAEKLLSHTRSTTDFIRRLKILRLVPENSILVTLDVSSLYTNIGTDEGLTIVKEELQKNGSNNPSAKTLTCKKTLHIDLKISIKSCFATNLLSFLLMPKGHKPLFCIWIRKQHSVHFQGWTGIIIIVIHL